MFTMHSPLFALASAALFATAPQDSAPKPEPRPVDLVICLDTSGSMNGLIDAARQGIWAIVNDLALAKPSPKLRLALLTFGNDGHAQAAGWVKVETEFTEDLDLVSQRLFALTTNGGTELVGRVMHTALEQLQWSNHPQALKLMVVAGNESADQDQEQRFPDVCKRAIERGVMVNSIYCGNPADNLAPQWREVAQRADGQFHAIDKDNGTIAIETPFDAQLQSLSAKLNETYLPFGEGGQLAWHNQTVQDKNATNLNAQAAATRAMCKATSNYVAAWDLVDACRQQTVKLAELPAAQLPEKMRAMNVAERQKLVDEMGTARDGLQKQIQELNQKREVAVAEEMKKRSLDVTKSFDWAVRKAVREQARSKGLAVPEPVVAPSDTKSESPANGK